MKKISGIYQIVNKINSDRYIGSSNNVDKRLKDHRCRLIKGYHYNPRLQKAWNKYGEQAFEFSLFIEVPQDLLLVEEQKYLDEKPAYNCTYKAMAFFTGHHHTIEAKEKLRKSNLGNKYCLGYKHPASDYDFRRGKPNWNSGKTGVYSEEIRSRISATLTGKKQSEETIRKRIESFKKTWEAKRRDGFTAKKHSDETRLKMSKSQKKRWEKRRSSPKVVYNI